MTVKIKVTYNPNSQSDSQDLKFYQLILWLEEAKFTPYSTILIPYFPKNPFFLLFFH